MWLLGCSTARLLGLSPAKLGTLTPSALTEFGHLLKSFVVGGLLKQASWSDADLR
jgi:hypothetical protein